MPFHGVRGLGRGGAFIAGADDPGGIWYNPATIDRAGKIQILVDGAMIFYGMDYTRVDSGGNTLSTVSNLAPPMPIPTIAVTAPIWKKRLWIGGSFSAGSGVLPSYSRPNYGPCDMGAMNSCIDTAHADAPQRYSVISFSGTLFLRLDLSIAWRAFDWLTLGVSFQDMIGRLSQTKAISSYNGTLSSGPEDPDFDSLIDVKMSSIFNPSAQFGATIRPHSRVTVGVALQLPTTISGDAELAVQLPVSPMYAASTVEGRDAEVSLGFPLSLGVGVEVRPPWVEHLRVEADFYFENWASVGDIRFAPKNIRILDLPGVGTFEIPVTHDDFGYRNSFSVRLGAEYALPVLGRAIVLRAGYGFERGATPIESTSLVSADFNKQLFSLGASYRYGRFRFDAGFGILVTPRRFVSHETSRALQINVINAQNTVAVGGGTYKISSVMLGLGVNVAL